MTLFFIAIWAGGLGARTDRKIGFWRRVLWPHDLGEALHKWALRERGEKTE